MNCEAVEQFVLNGRIVWTMTTVGYTKYTLNLVNWLTTVAKVPWKLCVVCCDKESETFFRRENVPYVSWNGDKVKRTQDGMAAFGTPGFEKCNLQKLSILEWFCMNYSACGITHSLYLDGDIVVRTDPWPLLDFKTDLLFQCDCYGTENHGSRDFQCNTICSGVIATRHVPGQEILYQWEPALWEKSSKQDQPFIASRLFSTNTPYTILERRIFGNGTWMKAGSWKNEDWCLLHYNYLVSSTKRTAMKANNHWLIIY